MKNETDNAELGHEHYHLEQQRLNNENLIIVNRERQQQIISNRIEHARRNVEILGRFPNNEESIMV